MKKKHRKILERLRVACSNISTNLDLTATHTLKLVDRQRAHDLVAIVLYGILCDSPGNPYQAEDMENALNALDELEKLRDKEYPLKFTEQ